MGPVLHMQSVVDQNIIMWCIPAVFSSSPY